MKRYLFLSIGMWLMVTTSIAQVDSSEVEVDDDWMVSVREEMPRFPGCEDVLDENERKQCSDKKMLDFVYSRLKPLPLCQPVEGTVVVQFTIEKDGQLTNIKIVRAILPAYSEEVIQIIKEMPDWIPGRQMGKVVPVRFNLPVRFKAT